MRLIDADVLWMDVIHSVDYCDDILEFIERQPTIEVNKWIPCNDRLPEDGQFVLVCNDDRKMMIAKYESEVPQWEYKYTTYDWDVWDDQEHGPVMAWMPLPEPYMEEST